MTTPAVPRYTILIDNNEQAPWRFPVGQVTKRTSIDTGDYTIQGFEAVITVERKSLNDLVHTVIHDWRRFSKQLRRMAAMDVAVIVVDASAEDLMQGKYDSQTQPNSVRGKLNAILIDYAVPTMFFPSREVSAAWVNNLFDQYVETRMGKR